MGNSVSDYKQFSSFNNFLASKLGAFLLPQNSKNASIAELCSVFHQKNALTLGNAMDIENIILGCTQNRNTAQEELYNLYSQKMLAVCYRYAKSRFEAEDMLQEGFIKVFQQIGNFRNEGSIEGWIRKVIVHTCINQLAKNKKFENTIDITQAEGFATAQDYIPSILQAQQVVECIRLLSVGYRTVLNLYAIEGYSHKEIAQLLNIEESSSRSQYTRARALLEELLVSKNIISKNQYKKNLGKTGI
jgi:RNA polymerase sigma factor (sigma-70 family)